jgi:hypothetical protein
MDMNPSASFAPVVSMTVLPTTTSTTPDCTMTAGARRAFIENDAAGGDAHRRARRLGGAHVDPARSRLLLLLMCCMPLPLFHKRARQQHHERCNPQTLNGFPFSGTITLLALPFMAATNLSAFGSMMGKLP